MSDYWIFGFLIGFGCGALVSALLCYRAHIKPPDNLYGGPPLPVPKAKPRPRPH